MKARIIFKDGSRMVIKYPSQWETLNDIKTVLATMPERVKCINFLTTKGAK
jgi:hypothetical protein